MSLKPCCFAGTLAKGMPRGEFLILGGVRCYVSRPPAAPSVDAASPEERQLKRAVLLLTDIFGVDISNGKLIADSYASAGYLAVMPDLFDGKPVPEWFLAAMTRIIADTSPGEVGFVGRLLRQLRGAAIAARVLPAALMFARHHMDRRLTPLCKMPIVETVVEDLRSGTTLGFAVSKLGAVGFCYGGGLCFAAASRDELIDAFVTCHTQVKVPATFEPLRKPGLLICCGQDWAFPEKVRGLQADCVSYVVRQSSIFL